MATASAATESAFVLEPGRERNSCLLVRTSLNKPLYFSTASEYLQHLINHGVYYSGARIEPCEPLACQLKLDKESSLTSAQINHDTEQEKDSNNAYTTVHRAVLEGKLGTVKSLLKQYSSTGLDCLDEQGFTPLLYAILTGAHDIAVALLKAGVSPDISHLTTGTSPLSLACLHGHTDLVKLLLKYRANTTVTDKLECSPLHTACWGESSKVCKLLLSPSSSLISTRDSAGRTALHYAAAKGDVPLCQLLLKKGCKLSEVDNAGRTALHWAILSFQVPCVEALISANSTLCNQSDCNGTAPVHYAAMTGQCEMMTILANKGSDISSMDSNGYSPLLWACACGHVSITRQLLQLTSRDIPSSDTPSSQHDSVVVNDNVTQCGMCLRVACKVGSLEVCQLLLKTSPSCVKVADEDDRTALHTASMHGHTDCVDELLETGVSPDTATHTQHMTSLHISSEKGHCNVVSSLLAAGASHDCNTHPDNQRPIHLAAFNGHITVLQELLKNGCAPDIRRGNDGHTALQVAAEAGHLQCCRLLLERGADPQITETTIQSRTALDLAMAGGHRDVADYLISQGGPSGGGIFHRAALTIQAVWRLHRHRRRCSSRREWSAAVIQRAFRRWRLRMIARRVRMSRIRTRNGAATIIQSYWKQYIEGRRRYEATCARLKARLHQEHVATSLLLEELQSQTHRVQLPPPTTHHSLPHTSPIIPSSLTHKAPATPGYLLQASAPPTTSRITSASLVSPTRHYHRPLTFPSTSTTRPRKPLTSRQSKQHHSLLLQPRTVLETEKASPGLPSISPKPLLTSAVLPLDQSSWLMNRGSSQSPTRGSSQLNPSKKTKRIGLSKSSIDGQNERSLHVPTISRSSGSSVGRQEGREISSNSAQRKETGDELPLIPSTRSLTSPPSYNTPPSPSTQIHSSPQHPEDDNEADITSAMTDDLIESSQTTRRVMIQTTTDGDDDTMHTSSLKTETDTIDHVNELNTQSSSNEDTDTRHKVDETLAVKPAVDNTKDSKLESLAVINHHHSQAYMRQTMFKSAPLGHKVSKKGGRVRDVGYKKQVDGCEERGEETNGVDDCLLGPIQRYDRLNHVLSLLQKVQGTEREEGTDKLRVSDLKEHIQSALDEAVRLRADTDSLQRITKTLLDHKSENPIH